MAVSVSCDLLKFFLVYHVFFDETKRAGLVLVEQMPHFGRYFSGQIGTCSCQNQVKFNFKQDF
jgi:hypothetical protein